MVEDISVSDVMSASQLSMNAISTARDNSGEVDGSRQFRDSKWQRQFRVLLETKIVAEWSGFGGVSFVE